MQNGNIILSRGDDATIGINILTSSGTPFDLTNYYLQFLARQNQQYYSQPLLTEITTGHINAISGLSQITFIGADTAGIDDLLHYYDIKLISYSGTINPSGITTTTLIYGNFSLLPSIPYGGTAPSFSLNSPTNPNVSFYSPPFFPLPVNTISGSGSAVEVTGSSPLVIANFTGIAGLNVSQSGNLVIISGASSLPTIISGNSIYGNSQTGTGAPFFDNVSNYLINDGILSSNGLINPSVLPTWTSENFWMVPTVNSYSSGDPFVNGAALLSTLSAVNALTGLNGAVLSANNPITIILPPAIYDLISGTLPLTNNFIHFVGLTNPAAIAGAVIRSSVSGDASGVININHANPIVYFSNLVFQNTATVSGNLQHSDNHATVFYLNSNAGNNLAWKNCQFIGKNLFNTSSTIGNSSSGPLFQDCIFPTSTTNPLQACCTSMGGKFVNCVAGTTPGLFGTSNILSFVGDSGILTSMLTAFFSPGSTIQLQDINYTIPPGGLNGLIINFLSTASGNGARINAGTISNNAVIQNSLLNFNKGLPVNPVSIDGVYEDCTIEFANVTLNSPLFKNCYIITNASLGYAPVIAGFPKFYGCRFASTGFHPSTSGLIDMQYCQLPSTWITPAQLTFATNTLASGFNVISNNSNFDSP